MIEIADDSVLSGEIATAVHGAVQSGNKVLLCLPGGSATVVATQVLGLVEDIAANIVVTLTDERYGPTGHPDANWNKYVPQLSHWPAASTLPVLQGKSAPETAHDWEQQLLALLSQPLVTTIALFGIGTDGHIAGIKPHSAAAHASTDLTASYTAADFERITITPVFFSKIDTGYIYVNDPAKIPVLHSLEAAQDQSVQPAQNIKQCGEYFVYYKKDSIAERGK